METGEQREVGVRELASWLRRTCSPGS
jgi:hypothetical protein